MSPGNPPGTWSGNLHASQINVNNAYRALIARFFGSSKVPVEMLALENTLCYARWRIAKDEKTELKTLLSPGCMNNFH